MGIFESAIDWVTKRPNSAIPWIYLPPASNPAFGATMNPEREMFLSYLRARLLKQMTRRGFLGAGTAYLLARWGNGHTFAQETQGN